MRIQLGTIIIALALSSNCTRPVSSDFLGSAVVEVKTFQIGTTAQGSIVALLFDEGGSVQAGDLLAVVDTVPLRLKGRELIAAMGQLDAQIAARRADIASVQSDMNGLKRELDRISGLVEKGAAPSQQKDDLQTRYETARLKVKAANLLLRSVAAQKEDLRAQQAILEDQISRCYIKAPAPGTILTRYKSESEIAAPGQPVFEMGKFDSVQIDFFVPQPVLSVLKIGQAVKIRIDKPSARDTAVPQTVPATITWISESAEFSPKNIQTRESRNELVFKVRAVAANAQRLLKRGMPVEVWR
jgi:HlyD family secretion protein